MDNTTPKSIPVAVTVASELEPISCQGTYFPDEHGFGLEFSIGKDRFLIEHTQNSTRVAADGVMSYDITLSSEKTDTLLATPYGMVKFDVVTLARDVTVSDIGVTVVLQYVMSAQGAGEMTRSVCVSARFIC